MRLAINTLPLTGNQAGAERYAKNIIQYLAQRNGDQTYVLILSQRNRAYYHFPQKNIRPLILPLDTRLKPLRIFAEQFLLPFFLRSLKVDLFFSPCNIAPWRMPVPLVLTLFDLHWFIYPELFNPLHRTYVQRAITWSVRRAKRIITISENSKKDILNIFNLPEQKVRVIYPGLDPVFLKEASPEEVHGVKGRYRIQGPYLLFVGKQHKRKNILTLLKVFRQLKEGERLPHQLVLAGTPGDGSPEIEAWLASGNHPEVIRTGFIPDQEMRPLYAGADALVYPSLYEGFGLPVLEAMACGCPVITSTVSSIPEVAGTAALLIDPDREDEMAEAILRLIRKPALAQRLREEGRVQARKFTWDRAAEETLEVFHQALPDGLPRSG